MCELGRSLGKCHSKSAKRINFAGKAFPQQYQLLQSELQRWRDILRLCFRKEYAAGIFADLHDNAEDIRIRTNVKLGLWILLSASSPNTYQRVGALPEALDSLCTCLDDSF